MLLFFKIPKISNATSVLVNSALKNFVTSSESSRDFSPTPLFETAIWVILSFLLSNTCKECNSNNMYGFLPPPARPPFLRTSNTTNSVFPDRVYTLIFSPLFIFNLSLASALIYTWPSDKEFIERSSPCRFSN